MKPNASQWASRLDAEAYALEALAENGDWEAICPAAAAFVTLLHAPLPDDIDVVAPRLERARTIIEKLLPAALAARDALGTDIRQLAKGRKAVSAYR